MSNVFTMKVGKLDTNQEKHYIHRDINQIDKIIIHHSATTSGSPESFARYHVQKKGWPGIGYHFVCDKNGIHQTNHLTTISYHVSNHNYKSIGVCHVGNFDESEPSVEIYFRIAFAVMRIDAMMGRQLPIHYHREFASKTCPGKLFNTDLFEEILKNLRMMQSFNFAAALTL